MAPRGGYIPLLDGGTEPHRANALLAKGIAGTSLVDGSVDARTLAGIAIAALALPVVCVAWLHLAFAVVTAGVVGTVVAKAIATARHRRRIEANPGGAMTRHTPRSIATGTIVVGDRACSHAEIAHRLHTSVRLWAIGIRAAVREDVSAIEIGVQQSGWNLRPIVAAAARRADGDTGTGAPPASRADRIDHGQRPERARQRRTSSQQESASTWFCE